MVINYLGAFGLYQKQVRKWWFQGSWLDQARYFLYLEQPGSRRAPTKANQPFVLCICSSAIKFHTAGCIITSSSTLQPMVNVPIDIHDSKNAYKDKKKKEIKTDIDKVYEKWGKNLFITYFVCFGDKKRQRKVYTTQPTDHFYSNKHTETI